MHRSVLDWYHFYLNYNGVSRLEKLIWEVCYWKGLFTKEELHAKPWKICQQFKNRKNIYGCLTPKNITELKLWDTVHVDLIGTYRKSIRQHQPVGFIIKINISIACMMMIKPAIAWFEIIKVPVFDLNEIMGGNDEYIDKSSTKVRKLLNKKRLWRYPHPCKVVFGKVYDFEQ